MFDKQEYMKIYNKKYRQDHKEEIKKYSKEYYQINKEQTNKRHKLYRRYKLKTDINYKISSYLRMRIYDALKNNYKSARTMELIGCSIEQLRKHLQRQFKADMSFSNYGKWHIDHIRPCASYNLSNPEEQKKCFNWQNLQPLWASENYSKNDKVL